MRKPLLKSTFIPLVLSIVVFSFALPIQAEQLVYPTPLSTSYRGSGTGAGSGMLYAETNRINFNVNYARTSNIGWTFPIETPSNGTTTITGVLTSASGGGSNLCRIGPAVSFSAFPSLPSHVNSGISTSTTGAFTISYWNNNVQYSSGFYVGNPTNETNIQACAGYITSIQHNGVELFGITDLPITLGGGTNELDMATTTKVIEVFSTQFLFYSLIMIVISSITLIFTIRKR